MDVDTPNFLRQALDEAEQPRNYLREQLDQNKPANPLRDALESEQVTPEQLPPEYNAPDADTPVINSREDKLSKRDLLDADNMGIIRQYMTDRYGEEMIRRYTTDEQLMERFVDSMRFYNGNIAGTTGEAVWISRASDEEKQSAAQAYDLFDRLGNLFVVDGVGGALDGIKDYVFAAARDPSNYIGLLSGGAAKAGALGSQQIAKKAIAEAARKAGEAAIKRGATQEAVQKAQAEAIEYALERVAKLDMTKGQRQALRRKAARAGREMLNARLRTEGAEQAVDQIVRGRVRGALARSAVYGGAIGGLFDAIDQNNRMEVGLQEKFSLAQTGLSALTTAALVPGLALVGTVAGRVAGSKTYKVEAAVGRERAKLDKAIDRTLSRGDVKRVRTHLDELMGKFEKTFREAAEKGNSDEVFLDRSLFNEEFIKDMLFEPGGIADILIARGVKIGKKEEYTAGQAVVDVLEGLKEYDPNFLKQLNERMEKTLGISLGQLSDVNVNMADLFAARVSNGATGMGALGALVTTVNKGIDAGAEAMSKQAKQIEEEIGGKGRMLFYVHNLWRRLLTSSPATTAINIAGFAQYYGTQTIGELFASASLFGESLVRRAVLNDKEGADIAFRQGRALFTLQGAKMRNLLDPHSTRANFETVLDDWDDSRKILVENMVGGHEMTAKKFGFSKDDRGVQFVESGAETAARISGVRAQDSVTKSQMFMGELDKYLRVEKDMTLSEVLAKGSLDDITEDMVARATETTLASVYAKNTTIEQNNPNEVFRAIATGIEGFSKIPILGTIAPFGRFMNNAIYNTYRDTAAGMMIGMKWISSGVFKRSGGKVTLDEKIAFGRTVATATAFGFAYKYALQQEEEGLTTYQVRIGNNIYNAQNAFPASFFLTMGSFIKNAVRSQTDPDKYDPNSLLMDAKRISEQLAFGQFARDFTIFQDVADFSRGVADAMAGDVNLVKPLLDGIVDTAGTYVSGALRPLDVINKAAVTVTQSPYARDIRAADGPVDKIVQNATKYTDNIAEALIEAVDSVAGTNLTDSALYTSIAGKPMRSAIREGDVMPSENIIGNMLGIKQEGQRNFVEALLDELDMPRYQVNERGSNPKADRFVNEQFAARLEPVLRGVSQERSFINGTVNFRRAKVEQAINQVRREINEFLDSGYASEESYLERYRERMLGNYSRRVRHEALKLMRRATGFSGNIHTMSVDEMAVFEHYVQLYKDLLKDES